MFIFLSNSKRKNRPIIELPRLDISIGSLQATEGGIRATIGPPLHRLSGDYPWHALPFVTSAASLLLDDESDRVVLADLADRLKVSVAESNALDRGMAVLSKDVSRISEWSLSVADRCPHKEVADMLRMVCRMSVKERDGYVAAFLG